MIGENLEKLFSLEGKVILMTGATGAIGAALAEGLAKAGGNLMLCDLDQTKLDELANKIKGEGGQAKGFILDIANMDNIKSCVKSIVDEFKKIDVLVNCAGINKRENAVDVSYETYQKIVAINMTGPYFLTQEVAKNMIENKSGSIINISSHNAVSMLGGCSVYGGTKSALTAFTRSQAIELAEYGIRSNAIAPGHILTPLTTPTWQDPKRSQYLTERIAMKKPGLPEDIVGITILLASDASAYMSGMMYHVDGGCLAGGQPWDLS